MPFGLQLKSIIVGILLAYFILPMIMNAVSGLTNKASA